VLVVGLVVALVPALRVADLTADGVGATPDGAVYLGVARNLVDGEGLTSPVSPKVDSIPPFDAADLHGRTPLLRWPPGYPVVLATGARVAGVDPSSVARGLAVVAAGVTALLVLALTRRWTGSLAWGVAAAATVALEPGLVGLSTLASSEPLYLPLGVGAVVAADRWWERGGADGGDGDGRALAWFAAAAVLAGAAWTVRFSGAALVGALGLAAVVRWVVVRRRAAPVAEGPTAGGCPDGGADGAAPRRVEEAGPRPAPWRSLVLQLAVLAVAALPASVWALSREASPYREAHRRLRGLPGTEVGSMVDTVGSWFASTASGTAAGVVLVAVVALVVVGVGALGARAVVPVAAVVLHVVLVVVSASYLRQLPVGGRMLAPVQPVVVALAVTGLAATSTHVAGRWVGWRAGRAAGGRLPAAPAVASSAVALVVTVAVLAAHLLPTGQVPRAVPPGSVPELEAAVARVPDDVALFSNDATGVYLVTGRDAVSVPSRRWQESDVVDEGYPDHLADLVALVEGGRAVVVLFPVTAFFDDGPTTTAELEEAGLRVERLGDGTVVVTGG
jgi:hypothetical protein